MIPNLDHLISMCLKDVLSLFSIIENTFNYFLKTIIEIVSASLPFIVIYHIDNNGLLICKGLNKKINHFST